MRQKNYRRLISIFAVWAALCVHTVSLPLLGALQSGGPLSFKYFALPIGFALLPISTFGLWNLRRWGFIALGLASILVLVSYPSGIHLHAICIVLTFFRYNSARSEIK